VQFPFNLIVGILKVTENRPPSQVINIDDIIDDMTVIHNQTPGEREVQQQRYKPWEYHSHSNPRQT
jgi:hypothetical protein